MDIIAISIYNRALGTATWPFISTEQHSKKSAVGSIMLTPTLQEKLMVGSKFPSGWFWTWVFFVCFMVRPACAQTATHKVRFYFNFGNAVEIELYGNESPLHVANFLNYVESDSFDDSYIHRSVAGSARFLQGGSYYLPDPLTVAGLLASDVIPTNAPVPNEFDANNGLSNTPGTLSAARTSDPDSATSGWFINITNNALGFDPGPYTVFGQVTEGLDLLNAVTAQPLLSSVNSAFIGSNQESAPLVNGTTIFVLRDVIEVSLLESDYNIDNVVDAADLALLKQTYGSFTAHEADDNGDHVVDGRDFLAWQNNFGNSLPLSSLAVIPEPSSAALAFLGFLAALKRRPVRHR